MPISSLPCKYGIGSLGKGAYEFADFLNAAGQKYWQILPIGPTSMGNSPYQSFSSYAGNPFFIDIDELVNEDLLTKEEAKSAKSKLDTKADYDFLYKTRFKLLKKASNRAYESQSEEIFHFKSENPWVDGYSDFMALKLANDMKSMENWSVKTTDASMEDDKKLFIFIQYIFFKQWQKLKAYVNSLGIKIIGDIPIYVPYDSADVYTEPKQFLLDEDNLPIKISGVPPDYFSKDGQLWGNPLYDYEAMEKDGFSWWIRRIGAASKMSDVIRIDHFRGFASYWAVKRGEKSAKCGEWIKGPGMKLVGTLINWFSDTEFIAEDLGLLTPDVYELLNESHLPGMRVLQFAFDGDAGNMHLPHNYSENCVCYTGTHDNDTVKGWLSSADAKTLENAKKYMGLNKDEGYIKGFIRTAFGSKAKLCIIPMQDYLRYGSEARINIPGTIYGNWQWRMKDGVLSKELAKEILDITKRYGRYLNE